MPVPALIGRRLAVVLGLVLSLSLAACSSPATSPSAGASPSPEPTEAPTATTGTASGPDLGSASTALANLSSYRFAIAMTGFGIAGLSADTPFTMDGTVVLKPGRALSFKMVGLSGDTAISYIVIGTDSWMDLGSGTYIQVPSDQANAESLFESFQPENLFGSGLASVAGGWESMGSEQKNGVATTHYHVDKDSPGGAEIVAAYGDTGAFDAWLADDGGYLVGVHFTGVQAGKTTPFEISFEISGIDDPANVITPPPAF